MSFCFDESTAIVEMSSHIRELLLLSKTSSNEGDDKNEIDTNDEEDNHQNKRNHDATLEQLNTSVHIIALMLRLHLMPDVFFDSQQPDTCGSFKHIETMQNMPPNMFTESCEMHGIN